MLKVLIFMLPTSMSPSTSMLPSRRGHGWFLMLMGSPLMLEISPYMHEGQTFGVILNSAKPGTLLNYGVDDAGCSLTTNNQNPAAISKPPKP